MCIQCQIKKEEIDFYKGYKHCKECHKERVRAYHKKHPEKYKEIYEGRHVRRKSYREDWIKRTGYYTSPKKRSETASRRARKMLATPTWLDEDQKRMIDEIYSLAKLKSDVTGICYHVDHIIPLKNKKVCGLHVPWNLQVIPAQENLSKSNHYSLGER